MPTPLDQHQVEIQKNKLAWDGKPLLREIYRSFYGRILRQIDRALPGAIVELGSGIGNLKSHLPEAISTDLFPNPWLDLLCDGYDLPFQSATISHLILFDVFHHLEKPAAFFREAERVLALHGRLILFEPSIGLLGHFVYGVLHHEPVAWRKPINYNPERPSFPRNYYAAQGNATRLFFKNELPSQALGKLRLRFKERFSGLAYVLSGGFSKPACYPRSLLPVLNKMDSAFSLLPNFFAVRQLVVLEKISA